MEHVDQEHQILNEFVLPDSVTVLQQLLSVVFYSPVMVLFYPHSLVLPEGETLLHHLRDVVLNPPLPASHFACNHAIQFIGLLVVFQKEKTISDFACLSLLFDIMLLCGGGALEEVKEPVFGCFSLFVSLEEHIKTIFKDSLDLALMRVDNFVKFFCTILADYADGVTRSYLVLNVENWPTIIAPACQVLCLLTVYLYSTHQTGVQEELLPQYFYVIA